MNPEGVERKKVLVSAIACNPYVGSEGLHGWMACLSLAKFADIWILVSAQHRAGLKRAEAEGLVPDTMKFIFVGEHRPHHRVKMLARLQDWWRYIEFSRDILPIAEKLHAEHRFDLTHHVTYSTWRVGSPLWRLQIPFIWGPISGTEVFPIRRFFNILSNSGKAFEIARILAGHFSRFCMSEVSHCAKNASHILAAHDEAVGFLSKIRGTSEGISVLSYYSFSPASIDTFSRPSFSPHDRPLKILAGGNLEGRKGVALAIQALALAKQQGVRFTYRITGQGSEQAHLKKLAEKLGVASDVIIGEGFSLEEYRIELKKTDIYLLPSLREGGGLTMMEAMLSGCVPIVIDAGGPGTAVTEECGFKIPVTTPEQVAKEIADAVVYLDRNREEIARRGRLAAQRIVDVYNDDLFNQSMEKCYNDSVHENSRREVPAEVA